MNKFKLLSIFIFITPMLYSCSSSSKDLENSPSEIAIGNRSLGDENNRSDTSGKETEPKRISYFNTIDTRNGMVIERYPFPHTWQKQTQGEFAYTGPNGIKVYSDKGMRYAYTTDPTTLQQYQYVGMQVKYPMTIDQVIENELMVNANALNRKMTKKYPLPQILQFDQNLDKMLFKVEQNPKQMDVLGIEWVDPDGTKWLTVLHYELEQGYNNVFWNYRASAIGASPAYFEQAKLDYLNGLLNRQINTQWISAMNQQNEYTIRKSNEAHAKREAEFKRGVAQRQSQWESDLQLREKNQQQWENNLEAKSRSQEHISDVILGKTNIVDQSTGERSKVDHNSDYYWVNSDGKYVGTDDYKYDPNKDDFINNRTWKEYKIDDYR
jgi:hypothetical protein